MAGTIYATMRKYDKTLHNQSNALKHRAERHAEHLANSRVDPLQTLRVAGVRCRFHNDISQHKAIEALEGGIPWNGHKDNIIDRFDGRALLDFYREPVQRPPKEKDEDELELEDRLNFESYRDLVKLIKQNTPEEEALQAVEKNEMEASAQKEYDRSHKNKDKNKESKPESAYATIGFSYASAPNIEHNRANADSEEDGSDSSGSSDDDSDSDGDDSEPSDGGSSGSDKDEGVGKIAKEFDIRNFRKLSRRERQEEKERDENPHNPRLPFGRPNPLGSRRQRRKNVRALRSQGVTDRDAYRAITKQPPPPAPLPSALRPSYQRRSSPSYDSYHKRSRSHSPRHGSRRQDDGREELPVQREYITAFGSAADAHDSAEEARRDRTTNNTDRRRSPPPSSSRPILEANGRRDPAELATSFSPHHLSERGNPSSSSSSSVPK